MSFIHIDNVNEFYTIMACFSIVANKCLVLNIKFSLFFMKHYLSMSFELFDSVKISLQYRCI